MRFKCTVHWIWIVIFLTAFSAFGESAEAERKQPDSTETHQTTYALSDLQRLALTQSEQIKLARESLYIAEQDRERAMAVLYPKLSSSGTYIRYHKTSTVHPKQSTSVDVKLNQSFTLNGKELIALRIARQLIKKDKFDLKTAQADYLFEITKNFYNILKAQKGVEIAQADITRKETHKNAVEVRLRLKTVPKTELYRTEAELSSSKSDLIRARNALNLARAVLSRNLGLPHEFTLIDNPANQTLMTPETDLETLAPVALDARSEMKALDLSTQVADNQVKLAQSAHWPQVGLEAGYTHAYGNPVAPVNFYPEHDTLYTAITLNFPIFEGGLRNAEIRQALAAKRQSQLNRSALAKQVSIEVEQALLELKNEQSLMTSLQDQLNFSKENYEAVTQQFDYGMANSIDVMDANTLLVTAERQWVEARFAFEFAQYRLQYAQGVFLNKIIESL